MNSPQTRERRPVGGSGVSENQPGGRLDLSLAGTADERPSLTRAEVYEVIRGRLAAHVIAKDGAGRVTCRSYVNLRAADRAVSRARERGCAATVVMVRQDVAPLIGGGDHG